jgi:MFS family permease
LAFIGKAVFMLFYGLSMIIGGTLSERFERRNILITWVILGILVESLFLFFQNSNNIYFFSAILGFSLGWGLPSIFAILTELTNIEERGRVSGTLQFLTFILVILILGLSNSLELSLKNRIYISILTKAATLLIIPFQITTRVFENQISYKSIIESKKYLTYLIPWIIYSLSNGLMLFVERAIPQIPEYDYIYTIGTIVFFLATCIFGIISGILADRSGRKQPLILGFISLGVAYASIGISLSPTNIMLLYLFQGIAWGFIIVSYQWVVLGDLSSNISSEKYFAVGLAVPPFIEMGVLMIAATYNIPFTPNLIASIISIIMFISVLPLIFAPETLPDNLIRDRRFQNYLKKVFEIVEESSES